MLQTALYHYQLKAALNHLYHISLLPCNVLVFVRLFLGLTDLPEERNLLKRNMFLHSKEKNSRARERDKSETNRSKPFCLAKLPGAQRREENSTQRLSCCGDPLLPFSTTRRVARVSAVCSSPLPRFRSPAAPTQGLQTCPVPVWAGTKPAQIQNLNLNLKNKKIPKNILRCDEYNGVKFSQKIVHLTYFSVI